MIEMVVRDGDCISLLSVSADILPRIAERYIFYGMRCQAEPLSKRDTGVEQNPNIWGLNKNAERPDTKRLAA